MKEVLVIGGGVAGIAAVHQLYQLKNFKTTLVERSPILGAGVRTSFYGGHPYTFGPRHFLTKKKEVFDYFNSIVPMRLCNDHQFITYVEKDKQFYTYPINYEDIDIMPESNKIHDEIKNRQGVENSKNFEEYWINSVGKTLYNKLINNYTKKMWLVDSNRDIDTFNWSPKGVTIKSGRKEAWEGVISAYPKALDGYNKFFDSVSGKCEILLNTAIEEFDLINKSVTINGKSKKYDIIVNTISPDILFNFKYGELPYIGRDFHKIVLPKEHVFPKNVYFVYYANNENFTRIVEYKKFTNYKSKSTLLGLEIPSLNGKHYPLPIKKEMLKAEKYFQEMPDGVFSMGRAGSYRYLVDIDDCVEQSFELRNILDSRVKSQNHPVLLDTWQKIDDSNPNLS